MYGTCLKLWEPVQMLVRKKTKKPVTVVDDVNGLVDDTEEYVIVEEDREVFLPKCLVILSTWPYLIAFREFLTQLNSMSKSGEMTLPVERYICNFCSELPAPPPGSFEVQTVILDSVIKMWAPPSNLPIAWVSLPFSHLFECLDIDNIILVWHCLILERQVLLTSTQLSILTTASEILLSLLFPFRWSHAYIPVLPHFLIPILSAPMPFLCGINKANLADALFDLSTECVLVDLDKNLVTLGPDTAALPPLPPFQETALRTQLFDSVGMVFREARSLTKSDDYSNMGAHLPAHVKAMAEAMWESKLCLLDEAFHLFFTPEQARKNLLNGNDASGMDSSDRSLRHQLPSLSLADKQQQPKQSPWDAVQESFLDASVYLCRNYRKYLVFPSKDNEGSYGGAGFRSKEFLESQRFDMRGFLQQLIGTQMFDNFITKRLYGSGEADVAFFDEAVDRFLKSAGLFSDVDLSGRMTDAASNLKSAAEKRYGNSTTTPYANSNSARSKKTGRPPPSFVAGQTVKQQGDPLIQSARVHRKMKTIVPPEPTGEGLPEQSLLLMDDDNIKVSSNDDISIHSASTSGTASKKDVSAPGSPRSKSYSVSAADIMAKKKSTTYTYTSFPSKFNEELFGQPRPLPAAVVAEFDRQRTVAAQFRRKSRGKKAAKDNKKNKHIQRAHATVDPEKPPSPEVASFTVFFMAFTAIVGKELLDIAADNANAASGAETDGSPERTILSTYVGTASMESESDFETDSEFGDTESEMANPKADDEADIQDEADKQGVAQMKTARPRMGGMFGDENDDDSQNDSNAGVESGDVKHEDEKGDKKDASDNYEGSRTKTPGSANMNEAAAIDRKSALKSSESKEQSAGKKSEKTFEDEEKQQQPRERFRNKLSDFEIEEAKATGRGQLALAFELLVMMKKRDIKADPDAYQCLIDACGRVGDTKRATELLGKMHEDGIVADGTVYACLVSAFSADSAWKGDTAEEELPEWANSTAVAVDWNKLQKKSLLDRIVGKVVDLEDDDDEDLSGDNNQESSALGKLRNRLMTRRNRNKDISTGLDKKKESDDSNRMEFFVTEAVQRQISLGESLLEIVFPDISIDTDNEVCPRCNMNLADDEVAAGWKPNDSNDYTTACTNCTHQFVPHFCVQCSSPTFQGSRGPASPLWCERLSPWVLQKEIRSVMAEQKGIENLLSPAWREAEYKNAVLWWNLVLTCMRYRLPFTFLLQGSFEQQLIAPMPEHEA